MENRKLVVYIFIFLFILTTRQVFSYEVETHAGITQEIVQFYNRSFADHALNERVKGLLMEGSIREDDGVRWMNHYYDPIYNTGLTLPGGWLSSKAWAHNARRQTAALYNPLQSTTLAFYHEMLDPAPLYETDFTWERAISDYLEGNVDRAMLGLGHILHLIGDASVPDHTRNDPHPAVLVDGKDIGHAGSPYELWAAQFTPSKINLRQYLYFQKPIAFNTLDEYFDGIALYSNKNFFSKDTIDDPKYSEPKVDYVVNINDVSYGFKKDIELGDYRLVAFSQYSGKSELLSKTSTLLDDQRLVLSDYWERLAPKAVQYGAGVVDLFFREVEKAKTNGTAARLEPQSFLAQAVTAVQNFLHTLLPALQQVSDPWKEIAVIPLDSSPDVQQTDTLQYLGHREKGASPPAVIVERLPDLPPSSIVTAPAVATSEITVPSIATAPVAVTVTAAPIIAASSCAYDTTQTPSFSDILISEVAWMGTEKSANDEWMELQNISGRDFDISGWQLVDRDGKIHVVFPKITIRAGVFLLLERTDDTTIPEIKADIIYVGVLNNSEEGLRLFDAQCVLIDQVIASTKWPAGDATEKRSMERQADRSWTTYSRVHNQGIFGTPRRENTIQYGSVDPESKISIGSTVSTLSATISPAALQVFISEVSAGTAGSLEDEFVELYNAGDIAIDLASWSLKKKSSSGIETNLVSAGAFVGTIAPKSFFLITHENYRGAVAADLLYSANSQNIAYTDNSAVLYDAQGKLIDAVHWNEIPKNGSIERRAKLDNVCVPAIGDALFSGNSCDTNTDVDFDVRVVRDPQNRFSLPEPRLGPTLGPLQLEYARLAQELRLAWPTALDARGTTTGIFYQVRDITNLLSSVHLGTTTVTQYTIIPSILGTSTRFLVQAFDEDGFPGQTSEVATTVPGLLPRADFYRENGNNKLDIHFDQYPFLPGIYNGTSTWKALAFYLNTSPVAPPAHFSFDALGFWSPPQHPALLTVRYVAPSGSRDQNALLLPDIRHVINNDLSSAAFDYNRIEDNQLRVQLLDREQPFTVSDYFTTALYDFVGGLNAGFVFSVVDETKYFFSNPPPNIPPASPRDLMIHEYDVDRGRLIISYATSTDPDGRDLALQYQTNFVEASSTPVIFDHALWQPIFLYSIDDAPDQTRRMRVGITDLAHGKSYVFGVRVIDERGGSSTVVATAPYVLP